ncbi:Spy/CpxP family protein refolding chaperone [Pseudoalteromonas sp. PAR1]|uniref:Spy/CpxP family protein refolding chaperone n=1 Tax=Pseudoalteromonas sp. PAR1 TaxID=2853443 RepID=UPI00248BC588|nr:Spy/CpxP family protein refolding chaperone [Pseudoalteromonas sp. PAR1]
MTISNKLSKFVLVCGLAAASVGTTSATAKGDFNRGMNPQACFLLSERGIDKLQLTEEQQTKLKAIFAEQKTQFEALRGDKDAMKAARAAHKEKMDVLLSTAKFDENAALELIKARQAKAQQFALLKMKSEHYIWQVLNTEQRESYQEIKKHLRKKGHKKGHHGNRGERKGERSEG